ncbi:Hypothetical_protein [Hexamita inflata]|uniref:Hypothetical_protein n=1 Tax=Hexamita inflata TaxID=28002 RepID=A0AA86N9Z0_9EUKA|nr:Hypothetical protein HINF_LOCUS3412 [Hexamita inflata]
MSVSIQQQLQSLVASPHRQQLQSVSKTASPVKFLSRSQRAQDNSADKFPFILSAVSDFSQFITFPDLQIMYSTPQQHLNFKQSQVYFSAAFIQNLASDLGVDFGDLVLSFTNRLVFAQIANNQFKNVLTALYFYQHGCSSTSHSHLLNQIKIYSQLLNTLTIHFKNLITNQINANRIFVFNSVTMQNLDLLHVNIIRRSIFQIEQNPILIDLFRANENSFVQKETIVIMKQNYQQSKIKQIQNEYNGAEVIVDNWMKKFEMEFLIQDAQVSINQLSTEFDLKEIRKEEYFEFSVSEKPIPTEKVLNCFKLWEW